MNRQQLGVIKKTISLTPLVTKWAKELAEKKGFGTNFSAYMADLIRQDKNNDGVKAHNGVSKSAVDGKF